ncbi:maleylpyruvate isomerase family mycothiol-dependent enzyme [Streptomyces cellulosae]
MTPLSDPTVWSMIRAERAALAGDLAGLRPDRWATPSLCDGLTVRDVLAHLTAGASLNAFTWLAGVVRCRFDFDKQVAMRLAQQLGPGPADTFGRFRRTVSSTTKPPLPAVAMLGETVTAVAEYYRRTDLVVVAKGRIGGLKLVADDGPFSTGDGPLVSGRTIDLVMALTGRTACCDELDGDGVGILRSRSGMR